MKNKIAYSFTVGYIFIVAQLFGYNIFAQTIKADTSFIFHPEIITPAYPKNEGPIVYVEVGHENRHLYGGLGSFIAFKNVLIKDGYQVVSFKDQFTNRSLREATARSASVLGREGVRRRRSFVRFGSWVRERRFRTTSRA